MRFLGKATGDLYIKGICGIIFSEIYVQDWDFYDPTEYSRYNSSGTNSAPVINNYSWDNTKDWICSFDLKVTANSQRIDIVPPSESLNHHLGIGRNSGGQLSCYTGKSSSGEYQNVINSKSISTNTYYSVTIEKVGTTVTFKFDNTIVYTDNSPTWLSNYANETIKYTQWNNGTTYIKNIKLKLS